MEIRTESIQVMNLCVPCGCRCRYCLLSWDGRAVGTDWKRGTRYAELLRDWMAVRRPELRFSYSFGYSMEHPRLREALRRLRELGSPQAAFLQCDGMKLRDKAESGALAELLAAEGVKSLNFTMYGERAYHDRFAGRAGDFDNLLRLMAAAGAVGLERSCGIPLTRENLNQLPTLTERLLERNPGLRLFLFVPHEEGRGAALAPIRIREPDLAALPEETGGLLNRRLYRTEGEWLREGFAPETRRALLLSLRADNMDRYEAMEPQALIRALEDLDEAYYAAFPTPEELAARYGDPSGQRLYRQRDLFYHYRRLYARDFGLRVCDVTDERQSGSRRY